MKKLILLTIASVALFMNACSDSDGELLQINDSPIAEAPDEESEPMPGLYVNSYELERVIKQNTKTRGLAASRSNLDYTVSTIRDHEGNPACYVVNFSDEGGFLIISAVKTANPVLAFNTTGNYMPIGDNPVKFWQDMTVESIEVSKSLPMDSVIGAYMLWMQYERIDKSATSRAQPDDYDNPGQWSDALRQQYEESITILNDSVSKWRSNGSQTYTFDDDYSLSKVLTDNQLLDAKHSCQAQVYYLFESQWRSLSVLRIYQSFYDSSEIKNYVTSTWHQHSPYNQSFPYYKPDSIASVGCGPLAIGRLMRHHQWPTSINWSSMPMTYATKATSDFLHQIAEKCNAQYGKETGIKTSDASSCLSSYGYTNTSIQNISNKSQISEALSKRHPVLIRGTDSKIKKGHMWLICGMKHLAYRECAKTYVVSQPKRVSSVWSTFLQDFASTSYYMDWGWLGSCNGYYNLYRLVPNSYFNFDKDIKFIYPKPNK